jgi:hypothetical protein
MTVNVRYKDPEFTQPIGAIEVSSGVGTTGVEADRPGQIHFRHGYTTTRGFSQRCDAIVPVQDAATYARALLALALQNGAK